MGLFLILSFLLMGKIDSISSLKTTQFTLPIEDRVAILKSKIVEKIRNKHPIYEKLRSEVTVVNEDLEYDYHHGEQLNPISNDDPRKEEHKFMMLPIKTTRILTEQPSTDDNVSKNPLRNNEIAIEPIVKNETRKVKKIKITDVFYRRALDIGTNVHPHCQHLITPYLLGHKKTDTYSNRLTSEHPIVVRLMQLLQEDTKEHTMEEIHSIMYQISNLQLRFYLWDVDALTLLLNILDKDKSNRHTFLGLKNGLKAIFAKWKLQSPKIENLMKQSRLFRPPCIPQMHTQGSTLKSEVLRYTKTPKPKKVCKVEDIKCLRDNQ